MHRQTTLSVIAIVVVAAACGRSSSGEVRSSTYRAMVPTAEQFAADSARGIPGGFEVLRRSGIEVIEVGVVEGSITVRLDEGEAVTRPIAERRVVRDSEGSGPFKGAKEILVLGGDPLVVGDLEIADPVIWPGSFDGSPVITIKSYDDRERGPAVSCTASEMCLLLTSGVDPVGGYEDANNPELDENPIASIEVSASSIGFTLDSGQTVLTSRTAETTTRACGLSDTAMWPMPDGVIVDMNDPVLVHAACPTTPGDNYLIVLERGDVPILAPLDAEFGGEWCSPGRTCLLFAPTG